MQRITCYDVMNEKIIETVVCYLEKNREQTTTGNTIIFDSVSSFGEPKEEYEKEEVFDIITKKEKRKKHWLK